MSEEKGQAFTNRYQNPNGQTGWAKAGATSAFKAINPELFIKPNKLTTAIGLVALSGCVAFIAYLHAQDENRKDIEAGKTYKAVDEEGHFTSIEKRKSRWD